VENALTNANSGRIAQLASAQGFAVIEPETREIRPGDAVAWLPMERLALG
jgi:molybdopterin biosynthesis enzyme